MRRESHIQSLGRCHRHSPLTCLSHRAVRRGNFVGAGEAREAKFAAKVSWLSAVVLGVFNSTMILIFRKRIGWIFSGDQEVIDYLAKVVPLIAVFQVMDVLTGATQGILRGAGLAVSRGEIVGVRSRSWRSAVS